jgi:hypothetical protein
MRSVTDARGEWKVRGFLGYYEIVAEASPHVKVKLRKE